MASIKVKFRPSSVADREGTIFYQIIHDRKTRQLLSDYHVFPAEWDEARSMVVATKKSERKTLLLSVRECIRLDLERLNKIVRQLDNKGLAYTADDVIDEYNRYLGEYTLFSFMEQIILRLKQNGKFRTAETYNSTLNSFKRFFESHKHKVGNRHDDIMLDCLNSEVMEAYEAWNR